MTFQLRPAKRENVHLLIGLAGGTGSGKTWSAMAIAEGLAGGQRFAVVDTENGRASHYADDFQFDVIDLGSPFTPMRYQEAIEACVKGGSEVIVVDSMTHEWDGVGGLLEWHEKEMGGREANNLKAWIKPKMAHRKFVTYLLQVQAHIILCFRAAERVEMVTVDGKKQIIPKRSLVGLNGWEPITEKTLPFELTLSVLLTADTPGVPKPIKLQESHRLFVPLDQPLSRETGVALARWSAGSAATTSKEDEQIGELVKVLLSAADKLGKRDVTMAGIARNRQANRDNPEVHAVWLENQIAKAEAALGAVEDENIDFGQPDDPAEVAAAAAIMAGEEVE